MARRPVPPILRQKMPWPKGCDPIGAEVPILLKEAEERVAAIAEYYGVEVEGPGWEEVLAKAEKRFEGMHLRHLSGQDAPPLQANKDLVLVYCVDKALADGGNVTDGVRRYLEHWPGNLRTLRTRYYKLTRPSSDRDRAARERMLDRAALILSTKE